MASLRTYIKASRPFSFTASATASLFGNAIAYYHFSKLPSFHFDIVSCVLVTVGCVCIHIVSNLLNTYYDERSGLDRVPEASGADNAIVKGLLTSAQVKNAAFVFFTVAALIGAYFVWLCGEVILYLIAFGAFSAWAYTAPPIKLKYRGLGDVQVILSFGILMIMGAYATQGYKIATTRDYFVVALMAMPLSLLVDGILHANNHRDREIDIRYGAKTLATRVTLKTSITIFYILMYGAFFVTLSLWILHLMPVWSVLTFLSLPLAIRAVNKLTHRDKYPPEKYDLITADTARVHLVYGVMAIIGLILAS